MSSRCAESSSCCSALAKFEEEQFVLSVVKLLAGFNGVITSFQLSPLWSKVTMETGVSQQMCCCPLPLCNVGFSVWNYSIVLFLIFLPFFVIAHYCLCIILQLKNKLLILSNRVYWLTQTLYRYVWWSVRSVSIAKCHQLSLYHA